MAWTLTRNKWIPENEEEKLKYQEVMEMLYGEEGE